MKILFLIIISLYTSLNVYCQDKFSIYQKAFNYIIEDSVYLGKEFKDVYKNSFCASNEIVEFEKVIFIYEIVDYEYDVSDLSKKFRIIDSLVNIESKKTYCSFTYEKLKDLNNAQSTRDYLIFFSDIFNNQLTAEILYNKSLNRFSLYDDLRKTATVNIMYYFYFDENNDIKKVFKNVLYY